MSLPIGIYEPIGFSGWFWDGTEVVLPKTKGGTTASADSHGQSSLQGT